MDPNSCKEARVTIGSVELTFAQSMSLRVAVGCMLIDLSDGEYMASLWPIGPLYQKRLAEIQKMLLTSIKEGGVSS